MTATPYCTYPKCKCIVSTSTTQPEPICPKGLNQRPIGPTQVSWEYQAGELPIKASRPITVY